MDFLATHKAMIFLVMRLWMEYIPNVAQYPITNNAIYNHINIGIFFKNPTRGIIFHITSHCILQTQLLMLLNFLNGVCLNSLKW